MSAINGDNHNNQSQGAKKAGSYQFVWRVPTLSKLNIANLTESGSFDGGAEGSFYRS